MLTHSEMPPLGMRAPDFDLPDTAGRRVSLLQFADRPALLVCFLCAHCDYTTRIAPALGKLAADLEPRGLAVVGVNANDDSYPEDAPYLMAAVAERHGWSFPFLHDETQDVARAYRAACTPELFLFDEERALVYRGRFEDLRAAAEAVLEKRPVPEPQIPSVGCNIKWRMGREPEWFHPSLVERLLRRWRSVR
jgi:peroxiredoxin